MSSRDTSMHSLGCMATAAVWCAVWPSIAAKSEKIARIRLVYYHVLLIFIDGSHLYFARQQHVGLVATRRPVCKFTPARQKSCDRPARPAPPSPHRPAKQRRELFSEFPDRRPSV